MHHTSWTRHTSSHAAPSSRKGHHLAQRAWVALRALIFILCLSFPGYTLAAPQGGPPEAPAPFVTVEEVTAKDVNPPDGFVGHVEAIQSVDLRARVQGYLEEVKFKEGASVKKGELLYVIEQAPYRNQVNAEKARVAKARATHTKAEQYLRRVRRARSGAVSADDIESAVSAELHARAAVQEAQVALDQAELNLSYTTIEAPISGRIGRTRFTPGNLVGPDSGVLARIVQMHPVRVVFSMSENRLSDMEEGRLANPLEILRRSKVIRLRLPSGEIYPSTGRPDFMDNTVDRSTGTIAFRVVFDNPKGYLLPGLYVTVLISMSSPEKLPVVPQAAVLEDREGRYVFVLGADNRAEQRRIETGEMLDTLWAVKSGLNVGERVVVEGIQKVGPGQPVRLTSQAKGEGRP